MNRSRRRFCIGLAAAGAVAAVALAPPVRRQFHPLIVRLRGRRTVEERLAELAAACERVEAHCRAAGVAFPPGRVVLLGLKDERRLEAYAAATRDPGDSPLRLIATYPVLAASGSLGPKLREGDRQVPEGVYALESLNPDSRFHVALRVGYPNALDRRMAERDGRTRLGGDIMIHGGAASVGCLAMGDPAAEELFVLAALAGVENVTIIVAPLDLRRRPLPAGLDGVAWQEIYAEIDDAISTLPPAEE